ncbi:hypothetical protein LPJ64_004436 [Coemansia asiatica]|uniref:protein O-GlcNAc transferase n=1 Tax=Coemansia asiatica TaxID=1052880 RepID=A0A9W7XJ54_9FUNG|nr:hypothetical protein LPJ64_004436 [Coemansia asiatica]
MNVDSPSYSQSLQQFSQPVQTDYFSSYATTTAQTVDRWAFNHASLLSNLSQLPPDLLPTLLPQINQQLQLQNSQLNASNMSALAAAAAVAAAVSASASANAQVGLSQQQAMQVDHSFAVPMVPTGHVQQSVPNSAGVGLQYNAQGIPGTQITYQQAMNESNRDHILLTAHQLYSLNARNPVLIEMLQCLHQLHPRHLQTLLLLAYVYFSNGMAEKSLEYNKKILEIDPSNVDALSNMGTTLRSMGYTAAAEEKWWEAIRIRPGYWDAVESLLGVFCGASSNAMQKDTGVSSASVRKTGPRYEEALQLCEFVDKSLCQSTEPLRYDVDTKQLSRLQSLLYSEGNLRLTLGDVAGGRREYEKAIEVVLGGQLRLQDAVVRIAYAGAHDGVNQMFQAQQGGGQQMRPSAYKFNSLPLTLLTPENAARVLLALFPATRGVLPGFTGLGAAQLQQANQVSSNVLLALAKLYQDHALVAQPLTVVLPLYYLALALAPSPSTCNNLGIILSAIPSPPTSTLVPSLQGGRQAAQAPMGVALALQYYTHGLQLDARHPHLYTNLGSLLKDLGYVQEAVQMYKKAIEFNPKFDVALANLGNAIKDMGCVQDSIEYYLRAAKVSPNFVEAVCGLANAMAGVCDWRARDGLWTEAAAKWHAVLPTDDQMATDIFTVMSSGRRPTAAAVVAKVQRLLGYAQTPPAPEAGQLDRRRGWMDRVVEIVDQQLADGLEWCRGLLLVPPAAAKGDNGVHRPTRALIWFLDGLSRLLPEANGSPLAAFVHSARTLAQTVAAAGENTDALSSDVRRRWSAVVRQMRNEGGWALRLVERVVIGQQRRLYHQIAAAGGSDATSIDSTGPEFRRPQLPTGMASPHWAAAVGSDFGELDPEENVCIGGAYDDSSDVAGAGGWVYTERMIYMPHTYFVNDHRQGFREDEELRGLQQTPDDLWLAEQDARYRMRRELFPQLADDVFIFANFNQLYKIDPLLFRLWLRILERVPKAIIWLLRFPAAGEKHLKRVAAVWAGDEVASRVVFTDVAPKHMHIKRGRIADAFLDTTECNAHTTAVDILWSGTPVLTWPRHEHKLCSRVAASVACATGHGRTMVVNGADEYVDRAVEWAMRASHEYKFAYPAAGRTPILEPDPQTGLVRHRLCHGPTMDIRLQLFMNRDRSRLFDTQRWTRNLEKGLEEAWRRWVAGEDEADLSSPASISNNTDHCVQQSSVDETPPSVDERKKAWCSRIEREIAEAVEANNGDERMDVFAPAGRSIWVCDDDDVMPAQKWVRELMEW